MSAKRGTAAGEEAGAGPDGAEALRRKGLVELKAGGCAIAANHGTSDETDRNLELQVCTLAQLGARLGSYEPIAIGRGKIPSTRLSTAA